MVSRILSKHILFSFAAIICLAELYPYSVKLEQTLNNLLLGKLYWCYSQATWETATLVCARNGHNLVQLITKTEQNWIMKKLSSSSKTFWVGGIQFQKNWYWKYSTWKIPISSNRWFMSYEENEKVVAHTDHLDSNVPNAKVQFICERNYFSRNDIFTKLTLHKNANQLLSKEDGGEIECASRCLLTYDCQLILLQSDGTCRLYSVGSPNIKIDCTSTGSQCFYRNKPKY